MNESERVDEKKQKVWENKEENVTLIAFRFHFSKLYVRNYTHTNTLTLAYTQIDCHENEYAFRKVHVLTHASSFMLP